MEITTDQQLMFSMLVGVSVTWLIEKIKVRFGITSSRDIKIVTVIICAILGLAIATATSGTKLTVDSFLANCGAILASSQTFFAMIWNNSEIQQKIAGK